MSAAPPVFGDLSRAEPGMIYMAATLVAVLGIDYRKYARTGIAKPGESSYDWSAMRIDATARVESLMKLASDAQAKLLVAERERDEAQAEVRAMLKDRIEEEEQARMRMLESVLAAAIHPQGLEDVLLRVHREYGAPMMIVTENGAIELDVIGPDGADHGRGRHAPRLAQVAATPHSQANDAYRGRRSG